MTNLNYILATLHAALLPCTALLLFLGHSDPRLTSTLAAQRAEFQENQQGKQSNSASAADGDCAVRGGMADDRALEELVVRPRETADRVVRWCEDVGTLQCKFWRSHLNEGFFSLNESRISEFVLVTFSGTFRHAVFRRVRRLAILQ